MGARYLAEMMTPEARAAAISSYGRAMAAPPAGPPDALGAEEREMIATRDSFYLATMTSTGWPYVQHRGGPPGFLVALDDHTLAFADLKGNRQLVSTGNVAANGRVSLLLVDYPARARLKILAHARVVSARDAPDLVARVSPTPELRARAERVFVLDVVAFDWNCPAYITPRYTEDEVRAAVASLEARIALLEGELREARS